MHASRLCKHLTWNGISQHDIRLYREEHAVSQWYPCTSHHLSIYRNFPKLFPQLLLSSFRSTCVRFLDRKGRRWLPLCLYSRGPHARARNGQTMQRGERVEHHRRSTLYWPRAKYQSKRSAARLLGFCEIILLLSVSLHGQGRLIPLYRTVTNGFTVCVPAPSCMFPDGKYHLSKGVYFDGIRVYNHQQ